MAYKLHQLLYIVCILLVIHNAYADSEEGEDEKRFKVLHLTDKTFDKYMSKNIDKDVLIMFYAPCMYSCHPHQYIHRERQRDYRALSCIYAHFKGVDTANK